MMDERKVVYEIADYVAVVKIDNPPVNALTVEMTDQLREAFESLGDMITSGDGPSVRAVVLTAESGSGVFVAGADINLFLGLKTQASGVELSAYYQQTIDLVANLPVPVICAVEGLALGGGTELSLACDIRIASERGVFGLTEVRLGVLPGGGGTQRLARLVGPGRAKEMIFSGRRVSAQEGYDMGVVEKVVPPGEALKEALSLAHKIAENSPNAVRWAKYSIDEGLQLSVSEGLLLERMSLGKVCESGDQIEGAKAFMEKRKPLF